MKLPQPRPVPCAAFAALVLLADAALAAPPPDAAAAARVEAAARQYLSEQATLRGLTDPVFEIHVATTAPPAPPCAQKTTAEPVETRYLNRMRFTLNCPGREGWQRPWTVRAEASAVVLVAAANLPAQRTLAEADLAQERRRLTELSDVLTVADDAVGQALLRPVRTGQPLTARLLAQPQLVRRGASVEIVARTGPVDVRAPGEALEAGRKGDVVRVRNTSTGRVVRARVLDSALVEPETMPGVSTSHSRD